MATRTAKKASDVNLEVDDDLDRHSGIPPKGRLGASKNEMLWLLLGVLIVLAIFGAFWFESFR